MVKYLLTFLLISNTAFGNCLQPVTYMNRGEVASCEGYLFSVEKELEVRIKVTNYDLAMDLNKVLQERIDVRDKQLELYSKELERRDTLNKIDNVAYFSLGAGLLTLILKAFVIK